MKLSTRQDIEAPQDYVFAAATDFAQFQRQAVQRGLAVTRLDDGSNGIAGGRWRVRFDFRGRSREMDVRVVGWDPANAMTLKGESDGVEIGFTLELMSLSRGRTRMFTSVDLRPKTLSARLLVQSMKLAKKSIAQKLSKRVEDFATGIERRYSASA